MAGNGQSTNADEGLTEEQIWNQEVAASNTDAATPNAQTPDEDVASAATTQAATTQAAAQVTDPPAAVSAASAADDPYANLSPIVKAELQAAREMRERLRKVEGHIGGLTSENKRLTTEVAAAKAAAAAVGTAPTSTQVAAAKASSEKWNQLKEEFPEWAEALEERLGAQSAQPNIEELRKQIRDEITSELTTNLTADLKAKIEEEIETSPRYQSQFVEAAHRGWKQTINTPAFTKWYAAQSPEVKALGASPKSADAIALLDQYKAQLPPSQDANAVREDRKKRLSDAASVVRGTGGTTATKAADDMTDEEYWNYLVKQRERSK